MNPLKLTQPAQVWYREPWPWIIMSGPAIVVVAGIATLVIAITSSDGLFRPSQATQSPRVSPVAASAAAASSTRRASAA